MLVSVEKLDKLYTYERKLGKMPTTQNTSNQGTNSSGTGNGTQGGSVNADAIIKGIEIIGGIASILLVLYGVIAKVIIPISSNEENIKTLYSNIGEIRDELNEMDDSLKELTKFIYLNSGSSSENSGNSYALAVKFLDGYEPDMKLVNSINVISEPKWATSDTKVATALTNDGIKFTSGELQNKEIVTMYSEGEKEIYFLGKYNDNNQWDDKCILNVYKNNELVTVFEGEYSDGNLKEYKRISCDEEGQWTVTERTNYDEYTDGTTLNYKKTKSIPQKINAENFEGSQILTTEKLLEDLDEGLISYYNGRTSNGFYNDDTGNAFFVKYFDDGEIEGTEGKTIIHTFYEGKFSNGDFEDQTDESWYITRSPDSTYMYYEGSFSNGSVDNKKVKEFTNPIGKDYIAQKLKEKGFEKYESEFYIDYE